MASREEKERRYLVLQAELKKRFMRENLLQVLIYEDCDEQILIFDQRGLSVVKMVADVEQVTCFQEYPLDCLHPLILEQQAAVFYVSITTLRGRTFKLPFADQQEAYQVAEEINRLWTIFW